LVPSPESRFFRDFRGGKGTHIFIFTPRFRMIRKVGLYSLFAVLALSCLDEPDCYNLNNNVIGISFRKMADNTADTVALFGITLNGTDSVFYPNGLATAVALPLDVLGEASDITFHFYDAISGPFTRDLQMTYTSKVQFVSEDCGPRYIVSGLNVENHNFDSVRLLSDQPGRDPITNYVVYRCPVTDRMEISFRQLGWNTDTLGTPVDVFVDSITSDFSPNVLYPNDTASTFLLPLNPEASGVTYHFNFTEGTADLLVNYRTVTRTRYTVCGNQTFFGGLTASAVGIDKILILRDSIRDPAVTNMLLQRCPDTNLIRIDFVNQHGEGGEAVEVVLNGITADYSQEVFYEGETVSSVILPLNDQADVTRFTFNLETGPVNVEIGYTRTPIVLHDVCQRMAITNLSIVSSEFTSEPQVVGQATTFPVNTANIAIIPD
jgi:hypothetical protein